MKILYVILLLCACLSACSNSNSPNTNNQPAVNLEDKPVIMFTEKTYNFGKIKKDATQLHYADFEFENTGKSPLVIFDVEVSCGCLSSLYFKEPVMPGEKGTIRIIFTSDNQERNFSKTVLVKSNASNNVEQLRLKGEIMK